MKIVQRQTKILEQVRELKKNTADARKIHFKFLDNDAIEINTLDDPKIYRPSPTAKIYHADQSLVKNIMGPFGSGKSTINLIDIFIRACDQSLLCADGVRRSRVLAVRNTSVEIETSIVKLWQLWCMGIGRVKDRQKPIRSLHHRFNDNFGEVDLEIIMVGLDRPEDFEKLKSTEYTSIYLNELSELPFGILAYVLSRCGRYPARTQLEGNIDENDNKDWVAPYWHGIRADTNPPDTNHWLYKLFEEECPIDYKIFKQPPGLLKNDDGKWIANPNAENLKFAGADYYIRQVPGAPDEEYIKVYLCGFYGIIRTGKPVYPQYNDNLHSVESIDIQNGELFLFGFDFGVVTPALLIGQLIGGQIRCIKEFCGDNSALEELWKYEAKPWISENIEEKCKEPIVKSTHDPSAKKDDTYALSCVDFLAKEGINSEPAITNSINHRVNAVKSRLNMLSMGKPGLLISRTGCPVLRKGLLGHYDYEKVRVLGSTKHKDLPTKIHPISDVQDDLQYICIKVDGLKLDNEKPASKNRNRLTSFM